MAVSEVVHSRRTRISCLLRLSMSAANEMPTTSGGGVFGRLCYQGAREGMYRCGRTTSHD